MSGISIVIPNHNGRELLRANLPAVLDCSTETEEIEYIVVDDASADDSPSMLAKHFPCVRVIALNANVGFGAAANLGVESARGEFVVLLNSDMQPQPNYLAALLEHLQQPDSFAAMAQQIVPEETRTIFRGGTIGAFKRGFYRHEYVVRAAPDPGKRAQPAFYAPGGGAAFVRRKMLELRGFDALFAPFYWEDVDLSVRAWRRGWRIHYEPGSRIIHPWSKTIYNKYSNSYIRTVSARNACLMVWKNALDPAMWREHWLLVAPWLGLNALRGNFVALRGWYAALKRWDPAGQSRAGERAARRLDDAEWLALTRRSNIEG